MVDKSICCLCIAAGVCEGDVDQLLPLNVHLINEVFMKPTYSYVIPRVTCLWPPVFVCIIALRHKILRQNLSIKNVFKNLIK